MKSIRLMLMLSATVLAFALPFAATRIIGRIAAVVYYLIDRTRRRALAANFLHLVDPEKPAPATVNRYTRKTFLNLALSNIDILRIPKFSRSNFLNLAEIHGVEWLDQALARGRGTILISAHLGNWELACAILARLGYPIVLVSEDVPGGHTEALSYYRRWAGVEVIMMTEPVKILKTLLRNKIVLVAGDRDLTGTGIELKFGNGRRSLPRGPALLALKTGAALLFGYCVLHPDPGQHPYLGVLEPLPRYRPLGAQNEDIKRLTSVITERVERCIKQYPDQWFVFQPEWR